MKANDNVRIMDAYFTGRSANIPSYIISTSCVDYYIYFYMSRVNV